MTRTERARLNLSKRTEQTHYYTVTNQYRYSMNKIEKAFYKAFVNAVLGNLCGVVNRIYKKGTTIPGTQEEKIAYIYLNSDLSIAHLIDCLNKEDVLADAMWDLEDMNIGFDSQDLEDGYNYAIAEVMAIFGATK